MKFNINGKTIEVDEAELQKAIEEKKESIDLNIDSVVIRTSDEDSTYKENVYKEAQGIGIEIGRKNILKAVGIEVENGIHKDDDKSLNALNSFIDSKVSTELEGAKIAPDKKVEELTKDINTLRGTIDTITAEKETALNQFNTYKKDQTISNVLSSSIPDNTILSKEDITTLVSNKIKADIDDNGVVFAVGQDGQPIKDPTTLEILPFNKVVSNFFDENTQYTKGASGGSGDGDSVPKGDKQTLDAFIKEMSDKGIETNGEEFNKELSQRNEAGLLAM